MPDGPVNESQPPHGTKVTYAVCYYDNTPSMAGPVVRRVAESSDIEAVKQSLALVYKRHHPNAWIETRLVSPWVKFDA